MPVAKILTGHMSPLLLAGLLYLGSGIGLLILFGLRRLLSKSDTPAAALSLRDMGWLGAATVFGGVIGPVLLMTGLASTPASTASLLLNLEGVFTAVLAWIVFKENADRRIVLGMLLILTAGILLAWPGSLAFTGMAGVFMIIGACAGWALDNNLTRKVSAHDALFIAGIKGLTAGCVTTGIALAQGASLPGSLSIALAAGVGFIGYGVSLALFVVALRHVGAARTGAYFSLAPFIGAGASLILLHESPAGLFWPAAGLMAIGLWLHLSERHQHEHAHTELAHHHGHVHDAHHQHTHDFPWTGTEPHNHFHVHPPLRHSHPHYPDIHHRHRH